MHDRRPACCRPSARNIPGCERKDRVQQRRRRQFEIYTINQNGGAQTRVTSLGAEDLTPAWSPAGSLIAFASDRAFGDFDIYRMDATGGSLLTLNDDSFADASPSWAPSGAELAITSEGAGGALDVFRLAADGSGTKVNVTNTSGLDEANPSWSADGTKIAFDRLPAPGDTRRDIFTINPDGTDLQNVTNSPNVDDREPNWSPDSARIAYASFQNGNYDVYSIAANGSGELNITNYPPANDRDPAWSPNGQQIVFVSRREADTDDLFLVSSAGSDQAAQITFESFRHKLSPDWQALPPPPPPTGGYPRPKGATPFKIPFVVAFQQCNSSNRNHGPPLAFPSCNPPVEQSTAVTVGTPDANGAAANSEGSMTLDVQVGVPGAPDDSDVTIVASITDVRCKVGTDHLRQRERRRRPRLHRGPAVNADLAHHGPLQRSFSRRRQRRGDRRRHPVSDQLCLRGYSVHGAGRRLHREHFDECHRPRQHQGRQAPDLGVRASDALRRRTRRRGRDRSQHAVRGSGRLHTLT